MTFRVEVGNYVVVGKILRNPLLRVTAWATYKLH